jgi:sirohydrochlorin cobaltochelatase
VSAAGIVLFAHGSRDPEWAAPFREVRSLVAARRPEARIEVAFLESASPTLAEAIDAVVAAGASSVLVVPLFLAPGGHTRRDLPPMVEAARARHPGVPMRVATTIGETPAVLAAIADWVARDAGEG